jgi:serine/threonine protein kinase
MRAVTLDIGASLGPYEITALLGSGGMGRVFRARDTRLKRDVAIKALPPEFELDRERGARFKREAEALAAVSHAHIAGIHDLVEVGGSQFLVLELVEGETLDDRVRRGPLPWREAVGIARQIADALETAHAHGIVHRDLKPTNVKITPGNQVKVLDFGLAKMLAPDDPAASGDSSTPPPTFTSPAMTVRGVILGTAAYMSPEQARGQAVGPQADIWALGCVLFEMLTGRPPFSGPTVTDVIAAVVRSEPDWSSLPDDTPTTVRTLLRRCLQKDRQQRVHDVADVRLQLEDALSSAAAIEATGSARRPGVALAWGLAAASALIAIVLGVLLVRAPRTPDAPEVRLSILTPATYDPSSISLSPDGSNIVFSAADSGTQRLWLRSLGQPEARPLPGTERATMPFWSPDSRSVAFFADGRLKRLDLDGGGTRTLAAALIPGGGTWGTDGSIVFAPNALGGLLRVSANGGATAPASTLAEVRQFAHRAPHFLGDGRHFVYHVLGMGAGVYVAALDGSFVRRLRESDSNGVVSGGHLFYVLEGTLFAQPFDAERLELSGDPFIVTDGIAVTPGSNRMAFSAAGGRMLAYRTGGPSGLQQLTWFDRTGKTVASLGPANMSALLNPDLSSDETRVVVNRTVNNAQDIWLVDVERGSFSRFTLDDNVDQVPVWFPDGQRVVFSSNRNGPYNLYEKPASGAAEERVLLETSENKFAMDISTDGRFLLYRNTGPNTNWDLWALPLGANGPAASPIPVANTEFQEMMGEFSPDGRWIAYQSNESGRYEIYVRSFPESSLRLQISIDGGAQPRWRSNGRELFYVALDGRLMAVPLSTDPQGHLRAAAPIPLFTTRTPGGPVPIPQKQQYAVSRDGQRFLVNNIPEEPLATPITVVLNWRPAAERP